MIKYSHPTAPLSSFNKALSMQLLKRGAPKRVLENVLKIVAEIKQQNLRLDVNTYTAILTAYSRAKDQQSVLRTLKEMKENDIKPSVDCYNIALEVRRKGIDCFEFLTCLLIRIIFIIDTWIRRKCQFTIKNQGRNERKWNPFNSHHIYSIIEWYVEG
jgi:pentatricopeptide repeat protein